MVQREGEETVIEVEKEGIETTASDVNTIENAEISLFGSTYRSGVTKSEQVLKSLASIRVTDFIPTEEQRSKVILIAVLDKSGSMGGEKLASVQTTMEFVASKLTERDQLAIVEYDTNVAVTLPITSMDESGKAKSEQIINKLRSGSSTNLCGGLVEGIRLLPSETAPETVVSILLMTDGHANVGIDTSDGILSKLKSLMENEVHCKFNINTFGFGADHNADLLKEIAQITEGSYYFIGSDDSIGSAFADCLGGLISVLGQGLELIIETPEGVSIPHVYFEEKKLTKLAPNKVRVALGNVQLGTVRDILFDISLPATEEDVVELPCATLTLDYYHLPSKQMKILRSAITISRLEENQLTEAHKATNILVDKNQNRVNTATATSNALKMAKENNFEGARALLDNTATQIENSVSGSDEFCVNLAKELRSMKLEVQSSTTFRTAGQFSLSRCSMDMRTQRSTQAGKFFDTAANHKMRFDSADFALKKLSRSVTSIPTSPVSPVTVSSHSILKPRIPRRLNTSKPRFDSCDWSLTRSSPNIVPIPVIDVDSSDTKSYSGSDSD